MVAVVKRGSWGGSLCSGKKKKKKNAVQHAGVHQKVEAAACEELI